MSRCTIDQDAFPMPERTIKIPAVTGIIPLHLRELLRQVIIELEVTERMPDEINQLPELFAVAYP